MTKAKVIFQSELCKGCELCIKACPKSIIQMDTQNSNLKGYHTAYITEQDKCTGCANCALMCPDSVISILVSE